LPNQAAAKTANQTESAWKVKNPIAADEHLYLGIVPTIVAGRGDKPNPLLADDDRIIA
jgi:hypothetical protein